jgi:hypothetical protein
MSGRCSNPNRILRAIIKKSIVGTSTGSKSATRSNSTAAVTNNQSGSKLTAAKTTGHTAFSPKGIPTGHSVTAGKVLAGKALAGKALAGKALAGKALAGKALAGKALAGKVLAGKALAGKVLAGKALAGKRLG